MGNILCFIRMCGSVYTLLNRGRFNLNIYFKKSILLFCGRVIAVLFSRAVFALLTFFNIIKQGWNLSSNVLKRHFNDVVLRVYKVGVFTRDRLQKETSKSSGLFSQTFT